MSSSTDLARTTMRRVSLRLLPFLFVLYVCNFLDRTNVAIAALQMNRDLHFSATAYGFGAGIFSLGYALFEVPSNLVLARVGARYWIARIMITWGLVAAAMMFVHTPIQFYVLRFLLGVAEAGFVPGILYYLSGWFPAAQRARALSRFLIAVPISAAIGNPLSAWLLELDGIWGLAGWRWLFLLEGIPAVLLGFIVLAFLPDHPAGARWLSVEQRDWLTARLQRDDDESPALMGVSPLRALVLPAVWLVSLPYFLAITTQYGYIFWAPTMIRDALHVSDTTTGLITGGIACVAAGMMLAVGASSDRTGERFFHASACAVLAALGCVSAALLPHPLARVAGLALVPIGVYGFYAPFWCVPTALLRGTAAAAGIALVGSLGHVGGFVGPYVVGLLTDTTGSTTVALLSLASLALTAAALCFVLRRQAALAFLRRPLVSLDDARVADKAFVVGVRLAPAGRLQAAADDAEGFDGFREE
jgi:ACS family tartrate transporter-like MFS transporter